MELHNSIEFFFHSECDEFFALDVEKKIEGWDIDYPRIGSMEAAKLNKMIMN